MLRLLTTCLAASLLLTACSRPSFINVPNDGGDSAINGPNWVTTVQIEKAALRYLLSEDPIPGDLVLELPPGTTQRTAFDVAADLSEYNVFPVGQAPSDEYRVIEVRKVVARGTRGRVDIIRPGTVRQREMVEVHMDWSAWGGWTPDYLRVRNIDVDRIDPLRLAPPENKADEPEVVEPVEPEEAEPEDAEPAEDTDDTDETDAADDAAEAAEAAE